MGGLNPQYPPLVTPPVIVFVHVGIFPRGLSAAARGMHNRPDQFCGHVPSPLSHVPTQCTYW